MVLVRNCTSYQISYKLGPLIGPSWRVPKYLEAGGESDFHSFPKRSLKVRLEQEGKEFHRRSFVNGTYYVVYNNRQDLSIVDASQLKRFEANEHNKNLWKWDLNPDAGNNVDAPIPWEWFNTNSYRADGENLPEGGKYKYTITEGFITKNASASRLLVKQTRGVDASLKGKFLQIESLSITTKSSTDTTTGVEKTVEINASRSVTKEAEFSIQDGKSLFVWQPDLNIFGNQFHLEHVRFTDSMKSPVDDLDIKKIRAKCKVL